MKKDLKRSLYFRKPLKSDNLNDNMKLNRFLGSKETIFIFVLIMDVLMFIAFNFIYNTLRKLPGLFSNWKENFSNLKGNKIIDFNNIYINASAINSKIGIVIYILFFLFLVIFSIIFAYKMRISYSEGDINKGGSGTQRWTTIDEIAMQYKAVPLYPYKSVKENEEGTKTYISSWYKGKTGTLISRWDKYLFIDTAVTNNLIDGTTRSGKGEMMVYENIDIISRAENIDDRESMILFDPKLELYKSCKHRLEERGYIVRLINIDNPVKSAGYNPLSIVIKHYKNGDYEKAQQQAKTYAFGIFNSDVSQEAIWKNTSTDLFTALIIAQVSDLIELDELLNYRRRKVLKEKQNYFSELDEELKELAEKRWIYLNENKASDEDLILDPRATCIPPYVEYKEIFPNEKNINCFSVINFFKDLCDRASISTGNDQMAFEKKAESLLDDYFNARPKLDFASSLYASIKSAGDRTKGSIYTNMQSALTIFSLNNIAGMTAENDIDFDYIGYGEKPVAIFMGIPSEDKSNHFLATTFVAQVYQYLFGVAKKRNGKVKRHVRFILDEFGNMPVIYNFASYITVCLGANMSFDLYLQSYSQLDDLYKEAAATIKENCANHFYIMSVGNDSAKEFSEMLGNKTVIETQRTGARFGMNKTFMESSKERPLMFPAELNVLREGECCIYRGMKRSDNVRAAILSYPILNEYQDNLRLLTKLKVWFRVFIKRRTVRDLNLDTGEFLSFGDEYRKNLSSMAKIKGSALLYRHEYMADYFPNANDINFDDICDESRKHIDYTARVNNPEEAVKKLRDYYKNKNKKKDKTIKSIRLYPRFYNLLVNSVGENFEKVLGFTEKTSIDEVLNILRNTDFTKLMAKEKLDANFKSELINIITREAL